MDDARDESGSDEAIGGQAEEDGQIRSGALELATSTTLVEVTPGVAVVFGEVPDGLELISLDMVPSLTAPSSPPLLAPSATQAPSSETLRKLYRARKASSASTTPRCPC